jgi:hypothetical protein
MARAAAMASTTITEAVAISAAQRQGVARPGRQKGLRGPYW